MLQSIHTTLLKFYFKIKSSNISLTLSVKLFSTVFEVIWKFYLPIKMMSTGLNMHECSTCIKF